MDRARKAGFVGNNFVQNQVREKMRLDHLHRLKKIRNRKPGSSVTLDNNPPDVVNKTGVDPKRKANKELFSLITERENKALLQRISTILTAKPKSNVADYYRMKKLIIPKSSGAGAHERHIQKKRIEKFFKNVNNAPPIYKVEVWEKQYKKQKKTQRFMREVSYTRPPGFVDPYAPKPETPEEERRERKRLQYLKKPVVSPPQPIRKSKTAAHVDRVRNVKSNRSPRPNAEAGARSLSPRSRQSDNSLTDEEDTFDETFNIHASRQGRALRSDRYADEAGDGYYEPGEEEDEEEDIVELAAVDREIRISEELAPESSAAESGAAYPHSPQQSQAEKKLSVYTANATVECFLVNHEYVVLSALVLEGEEVLFEAEAEITLEDLAILRSGTETVAPSQTASYAGSVQGSRAADATENVSVYSNEQINASPAIADAIADNQQLARNENEADFTNVSSSNTRTNTDDPDEAPVAGAVFLEASESIVHASQEVAESGEPYTQTGTTDQEQQQQQLLVDDEAGLRSIAADMVQHVELRVDLESGPRLILNLVSEEEQLMSLLAATGTGTVSELGGSFVTAAGVGSSSQMDFKDPSVQQTALGGGSVAASTAAQSEGDWASSAQPTAAFSIVSEDELSDMFLEDPMAHFLCKGMQVPVVFSFKGVNSIGNISALVNAAQIGLKNEYLYCLVKVSGTVDDQIMVKLYALTSTKTQFKRGLRSAVVKGSSLSLTTSLPSVIHADPELLHTFAQNLTTSVKILHDSKTGKNVLSVDEQS